MRIIVLVCLLFIFVSNFAFAEDVILDVSTLNQSQKNLIEAFTVKLLYDSEITYDSVEVNLPIVTVNNPSESVATVVTLNNLKTAYRTWKTANDIAIAKALEEQQTRDEELATSELTNIKLSQVNTAIDNISNLTEAKVFLKKLVRYLKARGL